MSNNNIKPRSTVATQRLKTYPKETDHDAQREQEEVPDEEATQPDDGQLP